MAYVICLLIGIHSALEAPPQFARELGDAKDWVCSFGEWRPWNECVDSDGIFQRHRNRSMDKVIAKRIHLITPDVFLCDALNETENCTVTDHVFTSESADSWHELLPTRAEVMMMAGAMLCGLMCGHAVLMSVCAKRVQITGVFNRGRIAGEGTALEFAELKRRVEEQETQVREGAEREDKRQAILAAVEALSWTDVKCEVTTEFPEGFPVWRKLKGKGDNWSAGTIFDANDCAVCQKSETRRKQFKDHIHVKCEDAPNDNHAKSECLAVRWTGL